MSARRGKEERRTLSGPHPEFSPQPTACGTPTPTCSSTTCSTQSLSNTSPTSSIRDLTHSIGSRLFYQNNDNWHVIIGLNLLTQFWEFRHEQNGGPVQCCYEFGFLGSRHSSVLILSGAKPLRVKALSKGIQKVIRTIE